MSAPSRAIFYKDGEEVGKGFINVGWFFDEMKLFHEINSHGVDFDEVVAYTTTYTREFIDEAIANEYIFECCRAFAELQACPVIKNAVPSIFSDELQDSEYRPEGK